VAVDSATTEPWTVLSFIQCMLYKMFKFLRIYEINKFFLFYFKARAPPKQSGDVFNHQ
jgi:hypothetical protein